MHIRFGVIGTGSITDKVLQAAQSDERFRLTAVYSRTHSKALEFASRYGVQHTFDSLSSMASSDVIDAVYIASPNVCHCEQSLLFMSHGKHVLCEKPLASNAREVQQMIDASHRYNVLLMEAVKPTLTPSFQSVMMHLNSIGKVRRYVSSYCQYSSRYDRFKEGDIANAFRLELSNGALVDIGIYTLYPLILLFGEPRSIQAQGTLLSTGVDGQGSVLMEYETMDAVIHYSKIANSSLPTEIIGEEGTITIDRINAITSVILTTRQGETYDLTRTNLSNDYYFEIREFIDTLIQGKVESSINAHSVSLSTMRVMDEIRRQIGVRYVADQI